MFNVFQHWFHKRTNVLSINYRIALYMNHWFQLGHFLNFSCAGNTAGGQDVCQLDTGGPLYAPTTINGKSKFVLVGIISYGGSQCGAINTPSVYTRVSNYVDWIAAQNRSVSIKFSLFLLILVSCLGAFLNISFFFWNI